MEVIIRFKTSDILLFNNCIGYQEWLDESVIGEYTDIRYRIFDLDYFARWYLSFADKCSIINPDLLKDKVRALLNGLLEKSLENR